MNNLIVSMLTENTGSALMDSGDMYGRHWEHNQNRNFAEEPATTVSFKYGQIEVQHSLYHWMQEHLATPPHWLQSVWETFQEEKEEHGLAAMHEFMDYLEGQGYEVRGFYGHGKPQSDNSYNGECLLDQTIQFLGFNLNEQSYLLLQVHGGCDVRGGYTDPQLFEVSEEFFYYSSATLECSEGHEWRSEDGHSWESLDRAENLEELWAEKVAQGNWQQGKLCYTEEGQGYCPTCGEELKASY